MSNIFQWLNYGAVCFFGCVLSAAFCGMGRDAKSRWHIAVISLLALLIQIIGVVLLGTKRVFYVYPLITHLPLALILWHERKNALWAFASVLTAYLCCQPRRWLALLLALPFGGGKNEVAALQFVLTLPLLLLLLKYVVPPMRRLSAGSASQQRSFIIVPAVYYLFDYMNVVYTDWLYLGVGAVVEFMPFVCCSAYLVYILRASAEEKHRMLLESDRNNLNLQVSQSIRELSALREAQGRAAAYRHDLRHHLSYLSACLENGETAEAQDYIRSISAEIEAQRVTAYCENEAVNLILASFAGKAEAAGVRMDIKVSIAPVSGIASSDLCVLLSNGLENALNACAVLQTGGEPPVITVRGYEKDGKLFLQITNPCPIEPVFEDGLPVTDRAGHGIGTRSIRAVTQRYGGLCSFSAEDGKFILRASL